MLAKVTSGANIGLEALPVTIEVDIASYGLPAFTIVGLADRAVEESRERVRSAIKNSGADFPARKITVNLAPADLPKEGPAYDLPIALGLLTASGQIPDQSLCEMMFAGELSLDGTLRRTNGILPLAVLAKQLGYKKMIVPKDNAVEASMVEGIEVYGFKQLTELLKMLLGAEGIEPEKRIALSFDESDFGEYDFSSIRGQEQARRVMEISAAGAHNVLLKGPPGAGKTLLARTFPSILPPLSFEEAIEVTKIYSISGNLESSQPLVTRRPFRAPHHTASYVGLIGGGNNIKPGEVSLAHRGVLFLDELPEFPRQVLEALRQPLEDRQVTISRAAGSLTFPAQFILIAAQNPCPCGFLGDKRRSCSCMPGAISRYQKRISGPLLDRIDICLEVPAVEADKLSDQLVAEDSRSIRERVIKARQKQTERFGDVKMTNSQMNNNQIRQFCKITKEGLELLKQGIATFGLSARGYHRVLKLSQTIADLSESENISSSHIAEALQYRSKDDS